MVVAASMDYAMVGRQLPWPPLWISPWMMGACCGWWGAARGGKGVAVVGKDTAAASAAIARKHGGDDTCFRCQERHQRRRASITAALAAQEDQIGSEQSILTVFIKQGVYNETLNITRKHVILIGEGAGKTVITGNKSHRFDNLSTPDTATVSVHGMGFMAQDLTIQNTAGPEGLQAVALMSRSHFSLVYRCSIEGYQDTLNADTGDQIYLETDIRGTIDFVFGYARAAFQGCRLLVRSSGASKPGAHNVVTAQGRSNPLDRSGFSFQNCSVTADEGANLTGVETFLGRPWKEHSHVIFMETFLSSIVNFTGWVEWNRSSGHIPDTVVYLEYANYGPGADTSRRINTTAVRVVTNCSEAAQYTADPFVNASAWMPKDKEGRYIIPYARGLIVRDPACPAPAPPTKA
ncbi:probable pectinesterase 56 [Sorghum bicolor]|nr:probable pectinesterase 56 [Sorghum bicolor]|eukprot:XP_021317035.1 probable pectinesterase 56 [Sorghum bicolor]